MLNAAVSTIRGMLDKAGPPLPPVNDDNPKSELPSLDALGYDVKEAEDKLDATLEATAHAVIKLEEAKRALALAIEAWRLGGRFVPDEHPAVAELKAAGLVEDKPDPEPVSFLAQREAERNV